MKGQQDLDRFVESLRAEKRGKNTVRVYDAVLRTMLTHIGKEPADITLRDLERYRAEVADKYTKASMRVRTAIIKKFFKNLGFGERIKDLALPPRPKRLPAYLTQEEVGRILEETKKSSDPRDCAILKIFLYEGLRRSELINLAISDINFDENTILIRNGKGDKDRKIPLHPEVRNAIINYLNYRIKNGIMPADKNDREALFVGDKKGQISATGLTNIIKRYAVRAGIEKRIYPHLLRHTALTHWYKATGDIRFVQKIAGHTNLLTTEIYVHTDVSYLKEVMEKARFSFDKQTAALPQYQPIKDKKDPKEKKPYLLDYFG